MVVRLHRLHHLLPVGHGLHALHLRRKGDKIPEVCHAEHPYLTRLETNYKFQTGSACRTDSRVHGRQRTASEPSPLPLFSATWYGNFSLA